MKSKLGLIISGAIVLLAIILVIFIFTGEGIPAPTESAKPGFLNPIEVSVDYTPLGKVTDTGAAAAKLYADAAAKVAAHEPLDEYLKTVQQNTDPQKDADMKPILDLLIQASNTGFDDPALAFSNEPPKPSSSGLTMPSEILYTIASQSSASYAADKDQKNAEECAHACFVLGYRLWNKGVFEADRVAGLGAMSAAASAYSVMYDKTGNFPNEAKAKAAKDILESLNAPKAKWLEKEKALHNLNVNLGDLVNVAEHDKDRTWRVDTIRWLGPLQWRSTNARQRRTIQSLFTKWQADNDSYISNSAKAAAAVTQIESRQF